MGQHVCGEDELAGSLAGNGPQKQNGGSRTALVANITNMFIEVTEGTKRLEVKMHARLVRVGHVIL